MRIGLLVALHLDPALPVMTVERQLRLNGLNVIHGGENALRFTPWFNIDDEEVDLITECLDTVLSEIEAQS